MSEIDNQTAHKSSILNLWLSLSQSESVLRAVFCYTLDKTQGRLKEKLRKQWLMAVNHFSTSQSWISLSMKQVFNGTRASEISSFNKSQDSMQGKTELRRSTFLFLGLEKLNSLGSIYRKWGLCGIMKSIYASQKPDLTWTKQDCLAEVCSLCLTSAFFLSM